ncbi:MAG TPA: glycine oxidase ThiO [Myxococcota bacterium]|nr:glycine oxidase ThiO [Myxococcota bacterium]
MRGADAIVVGGGVIGASVAWSLARAGASVVLFERDELGAHASGAAAGMLAPLSESHGEGPIFRLGLESQARLLAELGELRELSGVDPELVRSGVLRAAAPDEAELFRASAVRLAAHGCEWLDAPELAKTEPALARGFAGALWSPREAHVDARRLALAYAGAAARRGAEIVRASEVVGLVREGARVAGVRTALGEHRAHDVVLCTGAWAQRAGEWLGAHVPVAPVKGQMLALDSPALRGGPILWSRDAYLVPRRDGELRVGATVERAGFDARPTAAGIAALLAGACALAPALREAALLRVWAGLRPGTPDELPLVGRVPGAPGAWLAAGHYRNGVLLASLTGAAIASELLRGARLAGLEAFDPARFALQNPAARRTAEGG